MQRSIIRATYGLLLLLTPLIFFDKTSELFEFNKMLFIYLLAAVAGVVWLVDVSAFGRKAVLPKLGLVVFGLFGASQLISTILSIDPHTSFYGYYGRFNGGLLSIIAYFTLLFVYIQYHTPQFAKWLLKVSLVGSALVVLWGLPGRVGYDSSCVIIGGKIGEAVQYFFGHANLFGPYNSCWTAQFRPEERMFSTLGQPNWLGAYLVVNFFIGAYFFLVRMLFEKRSVAKTLWQRVLDNRWPLIMLLYLVFTFMGILFTRSRSSLLGLAAGGAVVGLCLLWLCRHRLVDVVRVTAILVLSLALVVIYFKTGIAAIDSFLTAPVQKQVAKAPYVSAEDDIKVTGSGVTESFDIRKIVWDGAIELAKRYPVFGTGVETFAYSYYFTRPQAHNLTSEWDYLYNKAHNEYLNYEATTGFVGLGTYLLMVLFVIGLLCYQFVKAPVELSEQSPYRLLMATFLGAYISLLVSNFFGFSTTIINIYFYLIPGLVIAHQLGKDPETRKRFTVLMGMQLFLIAAVFIYCTTSLLFYWLADMQYANADSAALQKDYQTASSELNTALKLHYEHVYEDKLSYDLAQLAFIAAYQKESDTANKLIQLSRYFNAKSIQASPKNVLYYKTTAKNNYLFYQITLDARTITDGIKSLQLETTLSPPDPKLHYTMALFYSVLEDQEKDPQKKIEDQQLALKQIAETIRLKENYRDAYLLQGQLLHKYGDTEGARKVFESMLTRFGKTDGEVLDELKKL